MITVMIISIQMKVFVMKTLEQGQEKIQKICNELREGTLEPAKKEAERIVSDAHARATELIKEAEKEAEELIKASRVVIEQERNVFNSSLSQGVKQGLEALKQDIEHKLFNDQLNEMVKKGTQNPDVVARLIDCIVKAIEKQGLSADITAIIPKYIPEAEVNLLLTQEILQKLKRHSVAVGSFEGGAQVKLGDKGLTVDISDQAIKELLSRYIRKDFRKFIFAANQ